MREQDGFFSKFSHGQFTDAANMIKDKSEKESKDQILFLLDRGLALFEAQDYKGAIDVLGKAERLTEIKDYTSINEELVSVITTDNFKRYYPLDYELIMINMYLALSYYSISDYEGALVECRRINNLIYKLRTNGMNAFEEVPIAWYISATIYEKQKKFDDAFIDYKKVMQLAPKFKQAVYDAYRTAMLSGNVQAANAIEAENNSLGLKQYFRSINNKKSGAVVLFHFDGFVPIKRPSRHNDMLPEFHTRTFVKSFENVKDYNGVDLGTTYEVLDIEDVARKNLQERTGRIVAKRLLGVGTQVAIGYGVAKATKNDSLGILAGLLVHATATPDLRNWSTLPRSFQALRFYLPKGEQKISMYSSTNKLIQKDVNVTAGDTSILILRSL